MLKAIIHNADLRCVANVLKDYTLDGTSKHVATMYIDTVHIRQVGKDVVITGPEPAVVLIACEISRRFNLPVRFMKLDGVESGL